MKITSAEFIKSAVKPDQYPKTGMPEIAFAGRSNVGKSSLINTLLGRKKLAQTSATPGKTRLINFFTVNAKLSFVDLPGYGFAKVSRAEQEKWGPMIETYLGERVNLRLVVSILDIRHDPTQQDRDLIEWLRHYGRNHLIVLTKSDKISRGEAMRRRRQIVAHLGLGEHEDARSFSRLRAVRARGISGRLSTGFSGRRMNRSRDRDTLTAGSGFPDQAQQEAVDDVDQLLETPPMTHGGAEEFLPDPADLRIRAFQRRQGRRLHEEPFSRQKILRLFDKGNDLIPDFRQLLFHS